MRQRDSETSAWKTANSFNFIVVEKWEIAPVVMERTVHEWAV